MALRVSSPVLVGRATELAALHAALDQAANGRPGTVLIGGEAGIGKSRLVREFADGARASGAIALTGGAVRLGRDEGLPYAPIVEALRGLLRAWGPRAVDGLLDTSTAELASLLPELGDGSVAPLTGDQRPDWALTRLFESVRVLLGRLGQHEPVVLVTEDLHWADRSTRALLAFLARTLRDERVLLVGTYRTDELHRRHPLLAWVAEMDRLGVSRILLTGLGRDDVRAQVEAITGRRIDSRAVDDITSRSGGNPFFAEELVAAGEDRSRLPASLRELLLARVGGLTPETQELLGVAAVGGETVDHDVLAAVMGVPEAAVTAAVREAVAEHLLLPSSDGERSLYSFRHALLQESVYEDLLPRDRTRLHARYAEVLAKRPTPSGAAGASHLAAIAHHAEASHGLATALGAWLQAARAAYAAHAAAEASHAYSRCLELWDVVPLEDRPPGVDLVDVLYEASYAHTGSGDPRKAEEVARRAVEVAGDRDADTTSRLLERLARTQWLKGDLIAASATLERAMGMVGPDAATNTAARVMASTAGILMLRGQTRRAIEIGRRALELAEAAGARTTTTFALSTFSAALADQGYCDEALETGRRGLAMALDGGTPDDIHRAYANLSTALQMCGRAEEAVEVALEGSAWAKGRGMWLLQGAFLAGNAANVRFEQGRYAEALELLDFEEADELENVARLNHAVTAGPLAVRMGRFDVAHAKLDGLPRLLVRARDSQFTGPLHRAMAELALEEDRLDDVQELVDKGVEILLETDDIRHRAALLAVGVEAAAAAAARDAARSRGDGRGGAAREQASRRLEEPRQAIAADGGQPRHELELAQASLATAEAEVLSLAGEDAAAAWGAAAARWESLEQRHEAAAGRYREAEALVTTGLRAEGEATLRVAWEAARDMGAGPLLGRIERLAALARLRLEATEAAATVGAAGTTGAAGSAGSAGAGNGSEGREPGASDGTSRGASRPPFDLTEREAQILPLLAAGYTNREIGETLFMSESTAGVHVSRIIGKMGVANRVEAAALAVRSGLAD